MAHKGPVETGQEALRVFGKKKAGEQDLRESASLEELRGQSLMDLLEVHAPAMKTDLPPRRPRGRSQHYVEGSPSR
jgi:hypothetical protein